MSVVEAPSTEAATPERSRGRSLGTFLRDSEIDTRMVGMMVVLLVIWVGFHIISGGTFLTPRNLWNLSVQTSSVGIMATGMVLVIVSRNIDLSVGSMVGVVGMVMALLQAEILPELLGLNSGSMWIVVLALGLALGGLIGAFQGVIIAYVGVPSFIVTLGGLLVWRGFAWLTASGRTIAPMDATFQLLGGGARGSLGETGSWIVGGVACAGIIAFLVSGRRRRRKFGFRLRPMWLDTALGVFGCAVALAGVWVTNSYYLPENLARAVAEERGIPWPEGGLLIPLGIPYPVLILIGVTLVMAFVTNRLRFGRYIFSIGGNPDAANLAGIKTRRTIVKTFMVMGILAAISAAVSIARLNAGVSGLGTLNEIYVIAAAVIGGTSLSGGIGTIT
ncbi:MAG: sugar ABC transporter permease, partial [Acidimicrobiia bacterium]